MGSHQSPADAVCRSSGSRAAAIFAPRCCIIEVYEPHSSLIARQRWLPSLPGAGGDTEAAAAEVLRRTQPTQPCSGPSP